MMDAPIRQIRCKYAHDKMILTWQLCPHFSENALEVHNLIVLSTHSVEKWPAVQMLKHGTFPRVDQSAQALLVAFLS